MDRLIVWTAGTPEWIFIRGNSPENSAYEIWVSSEENNYELENHCQKWFQDFHFM